MSRKPPPGVNLVDLISETVQLKPYNSEFKGLCPFHSEKTPSFHVSNERFHCFGCGRRGTNVYSWVMQRDNVDFRTALATINGKSNTISQQAVKRSALAEVGAYDDRVEYCKKRLPYNLLVRAIIYQKIGILSSLAYIDIHPFSLPKSNQPELDLIKKVYRFTFNFAGDMDALLVWESLVDEHWLPFDEPKNPRDPSGKS